MAASYKAALYTLGCKVSQYESEAIGEELERRGFEICDFRQRCDLYVINTCTVTAESDRKSRQIIRRAVKANPDALIIVVGCYSQRSPDEVAKIPGVSAVLGSADKLRAVSLAIEMLSDRERGQAVEVSDIMSAPFEKMCITRAPRTRAYVKIEDGCECRCSYCAIPSARGRVRSKLPCEVISEVEGLYRGGTREIVLTGIETASYGSDFDESYSLADLIAELDGRGSCERLRLGSLAPELIDARFVERVRDAKILAPHFHLSMQSGSDAVLRGMRRRYSAARALENIERLREAFPTAMFTTDMMVGFPGESEENFLETMDFVRRVRFLDVHVFAYSKRKDTPAALYPNQVPEEAKRERSERLIRLKNEVRAELLSETVSSAKPLRAILESYENGVYTAHTDSFIELRVSGDFGLSGEMVSVIPKSTDGEVICAKIC